MPIKKIAQNALCSVLVLLQVIAFPSFAIAQEAASEPAAQQTTSEPASGSSTAAEPTTGAGTTGSASPTGADSNTYKDNGDGTWSNGQYTWNSGTQQTKPNTPQEYSYNPSTGRWDTTEWVYHPESGKYEPNVKSSATNPQAASGASASAASINGTGPNSNNTINMGSDTNGTFDLFFNGAISNNISSNAKTGDALVQGNTQAGSALTGDAQSIANVLNMLQSSWANQGADVATFINNINGNVYGDLLIDPGQIPYTLGSNNSNIDVNIANNAAIDNHIGLIASTGNATVDKNTLGGDAASGNAHAMANVVNMINSAITAGKSFMGMVNINGTFDGDILLPPGVLEALIASTGPGSNNTIGGNTTSNADLNSTANRTINNNVDAAAATGNANVSNNTSAGSGTSGQANTSVNSMNLVGQKISGKNGMLVFVNVLGKWMGMIVSPSGASISSTGPNSNNTIGGGNSNRSVSVNAQENSLINNDISVKAKSGDANVTNNTTAGNATTGNADASVNLLNMIGSNVDVTDWFGVLFINVFGNWTGSFGADTSNGGFSQSPAHASTPGARQSAVAPAASSNNPAKQVFGFISRNATGGGQNNNTQVTQTPNGTDAENNNGAVFGSATPSDSGSAGTTSSAAITSAKFNGWIVAGVIGMIATMIVLVREYVLALREERLVS